MDRTPVLRGCRSKLSRRHMVTSAARRSPTGNTPLDSLQSGNAGSGGGGGGYQWSPVTTPSCRSGLGRDECLRSDTVPADTPPVAGRLGSPLWAWDSPSNAADTACSPQLVFGAGSLAAGSAAAAAAAAAAGGANTADGLCGGVGVGGGAGGGGGRLCDFHSCEVEWRDERACRTAEAVKRRVSALDDADAAAAAAALSPACLQLPPPSPLVPLPGSVGQHSQPRTSRQQLLQLLDSAAAACQRPAPPAAASQSDCHQLLPSCAADSLPARQHATTATAITTTAIAAAAAAGGGGGNTVDYSVRSGAAVVRPNHLSGTTQLCRRSNQQQPQQQQQHQFNTQSQTLADTAGGVSSSSGSHCTNDDDCCWEEIPVQSFDLDDMNFDEDDELLSQVIDPAAVRSAGRPHVAAPTSTTSASSIARTIATTSSSSNNSSYIATGNTTSSSSSTGSHTATTTTSTSSCSSSDGCGSHIGQLPRALTKRLVQTQQSRLPASLALSSAGAISVASRLPQPATHNRPLSVCPALSQATTTTAAAAAHNMHPASRPPLVSRSLRSTAAAIGSHALPCTSQATTAAQQLATSVITSSDTLTHPSHCRLSSTPALSPLPAAPPPAPTPASSSSSSTQSNMTSMKTCRSSSSTSSSSCLSSCSSSSWSSVTASLCVSTQSQQSARLSVAAALRTVSPARKIDINRRRAQALRKLRQKQRMRAAAMTAIGAILPSQ